MSYGLFRSGSSDPTSINMKIFVTFGENARFKKKKSFTPRPD